MGGVVPSVLLIDRSTWTSPQISRLKRADRKQIAASQASRVSAGRATARTGSYSSDPATANIWAVDAITAVLSRRTELLRVFS